MSSRSLSSLTRQLTAICLVLLAIYLTRVIGIGPDLGNYEQWMRTFLHADPMQIHTDGYGLSVQGVPFSQWSHGPGLFLLIPLAGLWSAILFWFFLWKLLVLTAGAAGARSKDQSAIALTGLAIALFATPLGFYSLTKSLECFSMVCLTAGLLKVASPKKLRLSDSLIVGMLASALLALKLQNLPYAGFLCVSAFIRQTRETKSRLIWGQALLALGVPCLFGLGQTLWVHHWMTGSFFVSPYTFGDAEFKSLDFRNLKLVTVLTHSWHGVLAYHPWFLIGVATLGLVFARTKLISHRIALAILTTAIGLNLTILAAWYCWWLGQSTFGQRGLILAYIPLTLAFSYTVPKLPRPVLIMTAVCAFWSYLLLRQGASPQFHSWNELLLAQALELGKFFTAFIPAAGLTFLVLVSIRASRFKPIHGMRWVAFGIFIIDWILSRVNTPVKGSVFRGLVAAIIVLLFTYAWPVFVNLGKRITHISIRMPELELKLGVILFVLFNLTFLRTALVFERSLKPNTTRAAVHFGEVEGTLKEYKLVEGFEPEKEALRGFIERAGRASKHPRSL